MCSSNGNCREHDRSKLSLITSMFPGRKVDRNSRQAGRLQKEKGIWVWKMLYVISIWEFSSLFSLGPWRLASFSGYFNIFANLFALLPPIVPLLIRVEFLCLFVCLLIFYYYLRDFARGVCMQINEKLQETKHGSCPGRKAGRKEARQRHSQTSSAKWELRGIVVRAWVLLQKKKKKKHKKYPPGFHGIGVSDFAFRPFWALWAHCLSASNTARRLAGKRQI